MHLTHLLALMQGFHDAYLAAALIAFSGFIASLWLRRGLPPVAPADASDQPSSMHPSRIDDSAGELSSKA